ncbi:hypothetical protein WDK16_23680, partial [Escherichia coli]
IDNGQLAPDLTEIRTSITDVSNEITQTVNKKLEDQSAAIQQIQKVQGKRAARTVLTGMCYSVGSATRQGEQFADPVYRPVGYD